jgi:hypothetical protein
MRLLFWIVGILSLLGGIFIALTLKSPIPLFSGIASLLVFGWMAEIIHGVAETRRHTQDMARLLARYLTPVKAAEPAFERDAPPASIRQRRPDIVPVAAVSSAYSAASSLDIKDQSP